MNKRLRHILMLMVTIILYFSYFVEGQSQWTYYVNRNYIRCLAFEGDYIWAGTDGGGVVKWDKKTGTYNVFSALDGLGYNVVKSIAIDRHGNKWFGTFGGGLTKFDGKNWLTYTTADGLANNNVNSVAVDLDGILWIGTADGLNKFDGVYWTKYTWLYNDIPGDYVYDVIIDKQGNKWIDANYGVGKFDGQKWTKFGNSLTTAIECDKNGNIWIGDLEGNLQKFDGTKTENYRLRFLIDTLSRFEDPTKYKITAISSDNEGNVLFATLEKGIIKYDGKSWSKYSKNDTLTTIKTQSISNDNDGSLWIGTWGKGILKYDGNTINFYSTKDDLIDNYINALLIDSKENKWIGTNNGLVKFDGDSWKSYSTADGLPDNKILSIAIDRRGKKWIGTNNGLCTYNDTSWTVLFRKYPVNAISVSKEGDVWIGYNNGVYKYGIADTVGFTTTDGLASDFVTSITFEKEKNIWFGTRTIYGNNGKGISMFDGTTWTTFSDDDGLPSNNVNAIVIDDKGNKWLGTDGGVVKFDGYSWILFLNLFKIPVVKINAIAMDFNKNYWFGSNAGIVKFDGQKIASFSVKEGLSHDIVTALAIDSLGNAWMGTAGGGVNVLKADFASTIQYKKQIPALFILYHNYPNPFNSSTTIRFYLAKQEKVTLKIYNVLGQLTKILVKDTQPIGEHSFVWDGTNDEGIRMASGIFFYTLQTSSISDTKKMILLK